MGVGGKYRSVVPKIKSLEEQYEIMNEDEQIEIYEHYFDLMLNLKYETIEQDNLNSTTLKDIHNSAVKITLSRNDRIEDFLYYLNK